MLDHTEDFVEVSNLPATILGMDTGCSLHNSNQGGDITARSQQAFESWDVVDHDAMAMEISGLKIRQQHLCNALSAMIEKCD